MFNSSGVFYFFANLTQFFSTSFTRHPLYLPVCFKFQVSNLHFSAFFFFFSVGRRQFARHEWAQKAAYLLGCTLEELSSSIFKHQAKGLQHSTSFRGGVDEANHSDSAGTGGQRSDGLMRRVVYSLTLWVQSEHALCLLGTNK